MIATIGVSIVVAGQFSGWNYGLACGWANMAAATALMCIFYIGMLQCVSELAATWPSAGGLGTYSGLAFGDRIGGMMGVAMGLALTACAGIVAVFVAAYAGSMLTLHPLIIKAALFIAVVLIHLAGTREAMWLTLAAGLVAVTTLIRFSLGLAPSFNVGNLQISPHNLSVAGVISAVPFALWLYLGVEQAVTASEETKDPGRDMPRGLGVALAILTLTAASVLVVAPGVGGLARVAAANDPLFAAISAHRDEVRVFSTLIGLGAVFGLIASFFSITYSASRQLYNLARTGYMPEALAETNPRGTPAPAVFTVAAAGFGISMVSPERILLMAVGASSLR